MSDILLAYGEILGCRRCRRRETRKESPSLLETLRKLEVTDGYNKKHEYVQGRPSLETVAVIKMETDTPERIRVTPYGDRDGHVSQNIMMQIQKSLGDKIVVSGDNSSFLISWKKDFPK